MVKQTDSRELLKSLVAVLENADIEDAEFDVRCMMEQVSEMPWHLQVTQKQFFSPEQVQELFAMTKRRASGEPLQYILGEWEFYGMRMLVGTGVLIPRADTEIMIDTVLAFCQDKQNLKILDLCTGSGCIALALKKYLPDAEITGIDVSEEALAYAKKNKAFHKSDVKFMYGDVLDGKLTEIFENLDLIVSNPPYLTSQEMADLQKEVSYEPVSALAGGSDGLDFYREITRIWKYKLKQNGLLVYEIGYQQADAVSEILKMHGFHHIQVMQDLGHRDRIVSGLKS